MRFVVFLSITMLVNWIHLITLLTNKWIPQKYALRLWLIFMHTMCLFNDCFLFAATKMSWCLKIFAVHPFIIAMWEYCQKLNLIGKSHYYNTLMFVSLFRNHKNRKVKEKPTQNRNKNGTKQNQTIKSHEMFIKFQSSSYFGWASGTHPGQLSSSVDVVNFI